MFLRKGVLKICSKFKGEPPCQKVILIKLQSNFIEIILRHGCSPVNLLHIFRTPSHKNTSGRLVSDLAVVHLPMFLFGTLYKYQKIKDLLMFLERIKRKHWEAIVAVVRRCFSK